MAIKKEYNQSHITSIRFDNKGYCSLCGEFKYGIKITIQNKEYLHICGNCLLNEIVINYRETLLDLD